MPPTAGWRRAWLGAQSPSSPRPQAACQALEGHPEAPEAKAWKGRLQHPVLADRLWGAGTSVAMRQENSGWGHAHFACMAIPWPAALEPGPPARPLPEYPRLSRQRGLTLSTPAAGARGAPTVRWDSRSWNTGARRAWPLSHAQSLLLAWEAMSGGLGRRAGAGLGPPDASWTLRVSHFYSKTQQAVTGVVKWDV